MEYSDNRLQMLAALLQANLYRWGFGADHKVHLLDFSENAIFRIDAPFGASMVVRVHRPNYHTKTAIESELLFHKAISEQTDIPTAKVIKGVDGKDIQALILPDDQRLYAVMFDYLSGTEPDSNEELTPLFYTLGGYASKAHNLAQHWTLPQGFTRLVWDDVTAFGTKPFGTKSFGKDTLWGHWRQGAGMDSQTRRILARCEAKVIQSLAKYGRESNRFGLIHADMRLGNLLVSGETAYLIDFDDCGLGWYLYDFAASISFYEDHPDVPKWKTAWLQGYQENRDLTFADLAMMDTLVMLRRLSLLGWMATHSEVAIAQELSPTYTEGTRRLAEQYWDNAPLF